MKKLSILLLALVLMLTSAVPAFAAGGKPPVPPGPNPGPIEFHARFGMIHFALVGEITQVNLETGVVKVTVACGNFLVRPYLGQELSLKTNEGTRFLLRSDTGVVTPITLADLQVGDEVSAGGKLVDDNFKAARITVNPLMHCQP
jgi:hypothetical protein